MSIAEPQFRVGQKVRLSPEITGADWETGMVVSIAELSEADRVRFEYEVTTHERIYTHCRQEQLEPVFIVPSIL